MIHKRKLKMFYLQINYYNYNLLITKVLTMFFEKDNQISIVDCHRFFDTILMKYIEINY